MTNAVTLTNSQQQALEKLKHFVKSNHQHCRLTGYAGTGKSFLIAQFMKWLLSERLEFIAASPTNKAAKNLKKIGLENNIDFEVTTVAKLLGQQPQLNKETGKEEFVSGESSIGEYDVVIFDEFSIRISSTLYRARIDLQDIEKFMENLDRRLTNIEKKNKSKAKVSYRLTDSQKYSIVQYVKKCLKSDSPIIIKEILDYLGLEPNHQGQQQQVAYVLKSQNLMKVRRRINSKLTSVWVK